MATIEYILDDIDAARVFINSLNRKTVRQRFSSGGEWAPQHLVLAVKGHQPVALADCIISDDNAAANASLLAHPKFSGYAIPALLRLKRHVGVAHWESTLRTPTSATVGISRRYFDTTYDQGSWEISNELMKLYGQQHFLQPVPILISNSFLQAHAIPPLHKLDPASRGQLLYIAANPGSVLVTAPNGRQLSGNELMALVFDLLNIPFDDRQHMARIMLLNIAAMYGHDISPLLQKHVDRDALPRFFGAIQAANTSLRPDGGIFYVKTVR